MKKKKKRKPIVTRLNRFISARHQFTLVDASYMCMYDICIQILIGPFSPLRVM